MSQPTNHLAKVKLKNKTNTKKHSDIISNSKIITYEIVRFMYYLILMIFPSDLLWCEVHLDLWVTTTFASWIRTEWCQPEVASFDVFCWASLTIHEMGPMFIRTIVYFQFKVQKLLPRASSWTAYCILKKITDVTSASTEKISGCC